MEIVETRGKQNTPIKGYSPKSKYKRRYVQPPKSKSFAPQRIYCPSTNKLETSTTYHLSYLSNKQSPNDIIKTELCRPAVNLQMPHGKISDDTTNKLSYKPVWNIIKSKPIIPKCRTSTIRGPMEFVTTVLRDYAPKFIEKREKFIPRSNIKTSNGEFESRTTTKLSYVPHGLIETIPNCKPVSTYQAPTEPIPKVTTQKLSYQPIRLTEREINSWSLKPVYRPPETAMCVKTTYKESFTEAECVEKEMPILPTTTEIFPVDATFANETVYKGSFIPRTIQPTPIIKPVGSISISDGKISNLTTNKLSFQAVKGERRKPMVQSEGRIGRGTGDAPMQCETTNRIDFAYKRSKRVVPILPHDNFASSEKPLEAITTTKVSYFNPGVVQPTRSFKPITQYNRPADKIDSETINKLSYQPWKLKQKEELPWAQKPKYRPPNDRMVGDTLYNTSYPAPGYYIDETSDTEEFFCCDKIN